MSASTDPGTPQARAGRAQLAERAARVSRLRRRVFATAAATFVLAFGVIAATGSLGQTSATAASTGSRTDGASGSTSPGDPSTTAGSAEDDGGASGLIPGLTTHQS
jgi:hypothetical protein